MRRQLREARRVRVEERVVQHRPGSGGLRVEHPPGHRLQQGHVAAEPDLQELVGELRAATREPAHGLRVLVAHEPGLRQRVHGDDARPVLLGLLERREHAGVVGARVLAHDHDEVGLGEVVVGDRRLADADGLAERGARGLVAHVRAVRQVVRAEGAGEQLVDERRLVGRAAARVERGLVRVVQAAQPVAEDRERLVPGDRDVPVGARGLVHGLDEPALLAQPVLGAGAQVVERVVGPELRVHDERRRLPRDGLRAVLAELRRLAPVRVGPRAAHAVEALPVVHRQQQLRRPGGPYAAHRRHQRVHDAGDPRRPLLRWPRLLRPVRCHAASPVRS